MQRMMIVMQADFVKRGKGYWKSDSGKRWVHW